MPRPKRTKLRPVKEARVPAPKIVPNSTSAATHDIQELATNPDRALVSEEQAHLRDSGSDVSLVSQGLKIASRRAVARKSQSGREWQPRETRMSGALRIEGDKALLPAPTAENTRAEKAKGHATSATGMHPRNGRTRQRKVIKKVTEDDKVLEELKKRRDAALQAEKASVTVVPNTQSSGVGTDQEAKAGEEQESTLTLNDTSEEISHGAVVVPSTPAVEASVVAIANFKRRPRQPSILRMVQQQQQQQEQQNQDNNLTDSINAADNSSLLGLSDPEDESTPLPNRAAIQQSTEHTRQSSSSRKRKASDVIDSSQARALQSSPPLRHTSPLTAVQHSSALHSDSPSLPDQSTIIHRTRTEKNNIDPESAMIESQAPPRSSSGEESGSETTAQDTRQRKQRKIQAQSTNNRKAPASKKPVLTTAQLRNMLPKSQRRSAADRSSPFEIHSSSSATLDLRNNNNNNSDYDELTLAKSQRFHKHHKNDRVKDPSSTKQPHRTYSQQQHHLSSDKENESASEEDQSSDAESDSDTGSNGGNDKADGNFGGRRSRRKASKNNKTGTKASKKAIDKKKALREIDQRGQHKPSAELQSIAKKFREIDEWKMSFESVDVDAGGEMGVGSSPWR